jgi:hypothetical protein
LGLRVDENIRLPFSSRHHESGVWHVLFRLEEEVFWILRGATGKKGGETGIFGRCNGRKTRTCKGDYSDLPINESPTVIWEIFVRDRCNE